MPCVLLRPGRPGWSRSFLVDLREDGPRPQLSVAQPLDLRSGEPRPVGVGEAIRLWSVHEDEPWGVQGRVAHVGVVESRGAGPVHAARLTLPWRLSDAERRLVRPPEPAMRLWVRAEDEDAPRTLWEGWRSPTTEPAARGPAWVVELSRRTLCFSVPPDRGPLLLPGSRLEIGIELREPSLRARVPGRVEVIFEIGEHVLYGLSLGPPERGCSADEHRELLRRAGI